MADRDPNDRREDEPAAGAGGWQEDEPASGAGDWDDGDDWAAPPEDSGRGHDDGDKDTAAADGEPPKPDEQHRWRRLILFTLAVAWMTVLLVIGLTTLAVVEVLKQSEENSDALTRL